MTSGNLGLLLIGERSDPLVLLSFSTPFIGEMFGIAGKMEKYNDKIYNLKKFGEPD